eukprot:12528-Heterococcus_DN1.PRE.1
MLLQAQCSATVGVHSTEPQADTQTHTHAHRTHLLEQQLYSTVNSSIKDSSVLRLALSALYVQLESVLIEAVSFSAKLYDICAQFS